MAVHTRTQLIPTADSSTLSVYVFLKYCDYYNNLITSIGHASIFSLACPRLHLLWHWWIYIYSCWLLNILEAIWGVGGISIWRTERSVLIYWKMDSIPVFCVDLCCTVFSSDSGNDLHVDMWRGQWKSWRASETDCFRW